MLTCGLGIRASLCSISLDWSLWAGNFLLCHPPQLSLGGERSHRIAWSDDIFKFWIVFSFSMLTKSLVLLIFSNFFTTIGGQYASDFPSPVPVVIKSPYFNFWLPSDSNLTTPGGRWPTFYTGSVRRDPRYLVTDLNNHACRM
jgi:hypothetical protein